MRMKKLTAGLLLALSVSLTVPFAASAENLDGITVETETETETEAQTETPVNPVTIKQSGTKYYLYDTATGKKVKTAKGVQEYPAGSKNYYYFINTSGRIYVNKLIRLKNGNIHYADQDGLLAKGFTTVGKNTYYFKSSTRAALKGWKKISGVYYYFTDQGVQLTGLQNIGKYTYYLDPAKNGAKAIGWAKVNKKWQYFSKKGRRQYGILTDPDAKMSFFCDSSGNRKTGLITFKGKIYYFDKSKTMVSNGYKVGGGMVTGWKVVSGKTYYFSQKGSAVTGIMKKDGKTYYFNSSGVMQTGQVTIGDTVYTFDKTTGAMTKQETISGTYSIKVNQGTCVVTIYRGNTPVKAMLCSVGLNGATPNGTFSLDRKIHWQPLFGNCYGQYTSRITGNILFHSVFYYRYKDDNSLATAEYNKLGQPASHGCVRLNCADAYYIYTKCPNGTKVTIFRGTAADDPLPRPAKLYINTSYDPTDPIKGD